MLSFSKLLIASVAVLQQLVPASAHTWLDCVKLADPNDRFSNCVGFPRGYAGRPVGTTFDVDNHYTNRVFNWDANAPACPPVQTNNEFQRLDFPRAKVQAGETVSALYQSNGHVNRDNPLTNSTHAFYWTGVQNQQITRMGELTPDNRLSALQNFDDCLCGEYGSGDRSAWYPKRGTATGQNIGCQAFFTVPPNTPSGVYQVVWYWTYNKHFNLPTPDNKEEYTTCFDIVVTGPDCVTPLDLPYIYTSNDFNNNSLPGPTYPTSQTDVTNGFLTTDTPERPKRVSDSAYPVGYVGNRAQFYGLNETFYPNQLDLCSDKSYGQIAPQPYGSVPPISPACVPITQTTTAENGQAYTTVVGTAIAPGGIAPTQQPTTAPLPPSTGPNFPQQIDTTIEIIGSTAFNKPASDPPKTKCALTKPIEEPLPAPADALTPTPEALPDCSQDQGIFLLTTEIPQTSNPPCFLATLSGDEVAATSLPGGVSAFQDSFDVLVQYSAADYRAIVVTLCKDDLNGCYASGRRAVAPGSGLVNISVFFFLEAPIGNDFLLSIWIAPQAVIESAPIPQQFRYDWKLYPFTVAALSSPSGCPSIPAVTTPSDSAAPRNFPLIAPSNVTFTVNVQYSANAQRVIQAGFCRADDVNSCPAISQVKAEPTTGGVVDIDLEIPTCEPNVTYVWSVRSMDAANTNKTLTWSLFNASCGANEEGAKTATCLALSQQTCVTEVEISARLLHELVPLLSSLSSTAIEAPPQSTAEAPEAEASTATNNPSTASPLNTQTQQPSTPSSTTTGVVVLPESNENPMISFIRGIHTASDNPNVLVTPFGNWTFGNGYSSKSVGNCLNNSSFTCSQANKHSSQSMMGLSLMCVCVAMIVAFL